MCESWYSSTRSHQGKAIVTIEAIPFEQGRFRVWSTRNPTSAYIVDLQWQEEPWHKAKPACGCIRAFGHHETCEHIFEVVKLELKRLGI